LAGPAGCDAAAIGSAEMPDRGGLFPARCESKTATTWIFTIESWSRQDEVAGICNENISENVRIPCGRKYFVRFRPPDRRRTAACTNVT
jgi:hypothetical protein